MMQIRTGCMKDTRPAISTAIFSDQPSSTEPGFIIHPGEVISFIPAPGPGDLISGTTPGWAGPLATTMTGIGTTGTWDSDWGWDLGFGTAVGGDHTSTARPTPAGAFITTASTAATATSFITAIFTIRISTANGKRYLTR